MSGLNFCQPSAVTASGLWPCTGFDSPVGIVVASVLAAGSRCVGGRSNPLPLALSAALYHILAYTHSFLTAQFVLLLTAQGFSERWGGWPCSWLALAMLGPAAARPWPQWWLGRSNFARPPVPEWAAESAAKPSCRGQPWVLGRSLPHYNPFM